MENFSFAFVLAGFVVGVIVGLTGVGGGSLMTPLLIFGFGIKPAFAVGTDLLFAAATKFGGLLNFARQRIIPWRVVLNECIDLAKEFGGTDGHKYVNAVLNQLALQLRATEVEADRKTPTADLPTAATE